MWPVSDALATLLSRGGPVATMVEVLVAGEVAATLDTHVAGEVRVASEQIRRQGTVAFADLDGTLTPTDATDLLAPFGNELRVWRGMRAADGTFQQNDLLVPVGTLRIEETTVDWPRVTCQVFDRAVIVQQARLTAPFTLIRGVNYAEGIQALLADRLPSVFDQFNFTTTGETTPLVVLEEQADPWDEAQKMATAAGLVLYFDPMGVCTLEPARDPTSLDVAASYTEDATSALLGVSRTLSAQGGFNGVVASGEPAGDQVPPRAVVWDTDPASPTYYLGPFGMRPRFYASPFVTTTQQAQSAATKLLQGEIGIAEQVSFTTVTNPAHEVGDPVYLRRAASGVDQVHVLDEFTVSLTGARSACATRLRRTVL